MIQQDWPFVEQKSGKILKSACDQRNASAILLRAPPIASGF
jgi:hypothetical protein